MMSMLLKAQNRTLRDSISLGRQENRERSSARYEDGTQISKASS